MRKLVVGLLALGSGCGEVTNATDAPVSPDRDASVDAPGVDAPTDAAPFATPMVAWSFEGNLTNTGAVTGYTLVAQGNGQYVAGKTGQAMASSAYVDGMKALLGTHAKLTIAMWILEPGTLGAVALWDCSNRSSAPYGGMQFGFSGEFVTVCQSSTSQPYASTSGGCETLAAPSANTWHHWLFRYDGGGVSAGQGAPHTEVYVDGNLVRTIDNTTANDPVWNSGIPDRMYVNNGAVIDELRIWDQVFTPAEQCTQIVGGTWSGTSCQAP